MTSHLALVSRMLKHLSYCSPSLLRMASSLVTIMFLLIFVNFVVTVVACRFGKLQWKCKFSFRILWVPYVTIFKQQQFVSNPMTGDNQSHFGFLGKYFRELDNNLLNGNDSIPLNWVRVLHFC
jgi:uncharacterized metal-binding protein